MAVEGFVGEAWIYVRPYTGEFAPQLERDIGASVKVADAEIAATGGLIGPETVAATERRAATAGERAGKAFNTRLNRVGKSTVHGLGGALLGGAAIIEVGKHAAEASISYQEAGAQIQANTGETIQEVNKLGDAFLRSAQAGDFTYKAGQIATAYGAVAGQLKVTQGRALDTGQALAFMNAAETDAEAAGADLGSTTGALAATMQAFHIPLKGVNNEADILFNVARGLNVPLTQVSSAVDRLHSRLGVASPSLADTGTLMVSFGKAGVQGQRGLMAVSSALSTLLSQNTKTGKASHASATQIAEARIAEQVATDNVIKAQKTYGKTSEQYAIAVERQRIASAKYVEIQKPVAAQSTAAQKTIRSLGLEIYNHHGKFVGMTSIIAQLAPKLAKMSDQQKTLTLQTLFGKQAAQLMGTVIAQGTAGWEKSSQAVRKHGTAVAGAEAKEKTLKGQTERLGAQFDALEIQVGNHLVPVLTETVGWFVKHQGAAEALAGVIGGVLVLAVARYVGTLIWSTAKTTAEIGKQIAQWTGLSTKAKTTAAEANAAGTEVQGAGAAAGTQLATAGETAAAEIESGAATAEGEMTAGGSTARTSMSAGGATAEAELAAGGATAEAELSAGGATAEGELAAGGATAAAEEVAGGAAGGVGAAAGGAAGAGGAGLAAGAAEGAAGAGLAAGVGTGLAVGAAGIAANLGTTYALHHTPLGTGVKAATRYGIEDPLSLLGIGPRAGSSGTTKLGSASQQYAAALKDVAGQLHESTDKAMRDSRALAMIRSELGWSPTPSGWHAPMAAPTAKNEAALHTLISKNDDHARRHDSYANAANGLLARASSTLERILHELEVANNLPRPTQTRFKIPEHARLD